MPKKYIDVVEVYYDGDGMRAVPATDVEEVKHGEWKRGEEVGRAYLGSVCFGIVYDGFTCSACGYKIDRDCQKVTWSYCPNCGAKMDGKNGQD